MSKKQMLLTKLRSQRLFTSLALSGCLLAGLPALTLADGNAGLTIFSGVERKDILNYYFDFGGDPGRQDRLRLYVPGKKLTQGASKFFISYPENFDGKFDTNKVEVRVKGESIPLREVYWDKESRVLEIDLVKPIEASNQVDIVLSNLINPDLGTYYLVGDVLAAGDIPVRLYLGTWIVTVDR